MTATVTHEEILAMDRRPGFLNVERLRALLWALHIFVATVAVISLITNTFYTWIDLRKLGPLALPCEILWVISVLLVRFGSGPFLFGWFGQPRWRHHGFSPTWARRFLWPTYFVLACLVVNTVYYYVLFFQGRADFLTPMPAVAFVPLAAWVLLTREWIRRQALLPLTSPCPRRTHLRAAGFALPVLAGLGGTFVIYAYSKPPTPAASVDLAVVLGGRLRDDGTATLHLADRTRVAIDLYNRGLARHILLSGYHHPPEISGGPALDEAAAMLKVCLDAGVPESAISLDPVGVNTRATAFNARQFMQAHGYTTVVACSTDFHLYRSALAFREVGIDAFALPAQPADWRCSEPRDALRELLAVVTYTLFPQYRQPKAIAMHVSAPRVVVHKSANRLELFDGATLVKTYPCITGGAPGDKSVEGDRKTPVGTFRVVFKNPTSKFHLSLGLDYPNEEDAARGLAQKLITPRQYDEILAALKSDLTLAENQKKLWYTPLGGEIFIHGHANDRPGTAGCVALDNLDIEELYAILPLNSPVEIKP